MVPGLLTGGFTCNLCLKFGNAADGVWHCIQCQYDAHPICLANRQQVLSSSEVAESRRKGLTLHVS